MLVRWLGEDGGAQGFELGGEVGGLVAGSSDDDVFVGEVHQWHRSKMFALECSQRISAMIQ